MSDTNRITAETEKFQVAVRKLSSDINQVGIDWHDEKHSKLAGLVSDIAKSTKSVMSISDQFVGSIRSFDNAASS